MTPLTDFRDEYAIVNEDKVRLHYVIGGEGPALLLIPGWPQTAYTWQKSCRNLRSTHLYRRLIRAAWVIRIVH